MHGNAVYLPSICQVEIEPVLSIKSDDLRRTRALANALQAEATGESGIITRALPAF